jgi:endonuclease G, mitochondrial
MKILKLLGILCLFAYQLSAQTYIDTVIHNPIYTSYYSTKLKNPVFVTYTIYKGGGNCGQAEQNLKFKDLPFTAKASDYEEPVYDQGHLVNCEDFAFSCEKARETFWYYNCTPQTVNLNRGKWKTDETSIREQSKQAKMLVICGSYFSNKTIGNGVYVPKICWKVVQNTKTKEIVLCRTYTNTSTCEIKDLTLGEMENLTKVKIGAYLK